jgi:hypothetical protein
MPNPNMEVYKPESVNLGEISEFGGFNTVGEYIGRLNRMDPTTSAKGDPMLVAFFEILEGPYEGEEIRFQFWLGARKDKDSGRIFAPGVSEFKQACSMIGQPLGDIDFKLDAAAAGRIFGAQFISKRVRIKVLPDPDRKDKDGQKVEGKWIDGKWQGPVRPKILGLASGAPSGLSPAASNAMQSESPLKGIV